MYHKLRTAAQHFSVHPLVLQYMGVFWSIACNVDLHCSKKKYLRDSIFWRPMVCTENFVDSRTEASYMHSDRVAEINCPTSLLFYHFRFKFLGVVAKIAKFAIHLYEIHVNL